MRPHTARKPGLPSGGAMLSPVSRYAHRAHASLFCLTASRAGAGPGDIKRPVSARRARMRAADARLANDNTRLHRGRAPRAVVEARMLRPRSRADKRRGDADDDPEIPAGDPAASLRSELRRPSVRIRARHRLAHRRGSARGSGLWHRTTLLDTTRQARLSSPKDTELSTDHACTCAGYAGQTLALAVGHDARRSRRRRSAHVRAQNAVILVNFETTLAAVTVATRGTSCYPTARSMDNSYGETWLTGDVVSGSTIPVSPPGVT